MIIRFLMRLNNKNHTHHFSKIVDLLRSLLNKGICEDLRNKKSQPEDWYNTKRGLALLFVTTYKSKSEASELHTLFKESLS